MYIIHTHTRIYIIFKFYLKILTTDEDKVFDLKYVRHTPRLYKCSDIDTNQDDVMSDGTFKLSIGRINCVIISKILYDLRVRYIYAQYLYYYDIDTHFSCFRRIS